LSVLNFPVYLFFYESNQTANCSSRNIQECFDKLSLGSIGQNEVACSTLNFAKSREINFSCSSKFAKLTDIKFIGISKADTSNCN